VKKINDIIRSKLKTPEEHSTGKLTWLFHKSILLYRQIERQINRVLSRLRESWDIKPSAMCVP
jgi:hypothetical protein